MTLQVIQSHQETHMAVRLDPKATIQLIPNCVFVISCYKSSLFSCEYVLIAHIIMGCASFCTNPALHTSKCCTKAQVPYTHSRLSQIPTQNICPKCLRTCPPVCPFCVTRKNPHFILIVFAMLGTKRHLTLVQLLTITSFSCRTIKKCPTTDKKLSNTSKSTK